MKDKVNKNDAYLTGILTGIRIMSESLEVFSNSGQELTADFINLVAEQAISNTELKIRQTQ